MRRPLPLFPSFFKFHSKTLLLQAFQMINDALVFRARVVILYVGQKSDQMALLFGGQLFQQLGKVLRVLASVSRCGKDLDKYKCDFVYQYRAESRYGQLMPEERP